MFAFWPVQVIVRALMDGGGHAAEAGRSRAGADKHLGWSNGPDYLLVLRSRHCQTVGLVELREEAKNGLLVGNSTLQVWLVNRREESLRPQARAAVRGETAMCSWGRKCSMMGRVREAILCLSRHSRAYQGFPCVGLLNKPPAARCAY